MSTRSRIGILKKDGSIDSIYCHLDGYPEGVGLKLYKHYNNIEKINKLIQLGDISHLENKIKPFPLIKHEFGYDTEQKNVVVAYHRDRKEEWERVKPTHSQNIKEFEQYCKESDQEYAYLYDEKKKIFLWSSIPWETNEKMNFESLEDKLLKLKVIKNKKEKQIMELY